MNAEWSLQSRIKDNAVRAGDGAGLDLPQVQPDDPDVLVDAQLGLLGGVVVGVVDLRVDPPALVGGVVDLPRLPLALVVGVVDHGRLPLAVHLVVPVLGLGGVGVGDGLGLLPVLGLGVLGIVDLLPLVPLVLAGLLGLGVLDLLGGEHVPVVGQGSLLGGLVVDQHLVGVVGGVEDQGVQV